MIKSMNNIRLKEEQVEPEYPGAFESSVSKEQGTMRFSNASREHGTLLLPFFLLTGWGCGFTIVWVFLCEALESAGANVRV